MGVSRAEFCDQMAMSWLRATTAILLAGVAAAGTPAALFQQRIDTAIAAGTPGGIVYAGGLIEFPADVSLRIFGAHGLTIEAAGSTTLSFGCGAGVHIANSSAVSFTGFTIDYKDACFAQGTVVKPPPADPAAPAATAAATTWRRDAAAAAAVQRSRSTVADAAARMRGSRSGAAGAAGVESAEVAFSAAFPGPQFTVAIADAGTLKVTFWDPATNRIVAHGK